MKELFRLKIASKRQMTAPQRLLDLLGISEGDEIQLEVADGQVAAVHACKAVPTVLMTEDLLSKIKEREKQLMQGQGLSVEEAFANDEEMTAARSARGERTNRTNTAR